MSSPSATAVAVVSTPGITSMLQIPDRHAELPPSSPAPSILPPLPPDCSPVARSSSPRHHVSASSPPSTSRRTSRLSNPPAPTTSPSTPTRRRQSLHSPCLRSLRRSITASATLDPPVLWGEDTITNHASSNNTVAAAGGEDEDFLSTFADHDFSSPSTYPSFTATLPAGEASRPEQPAFRPQLAIASIPGSAAAPPRPSSACNRLFAAPSRSTTTQLSWSTVGESQNTIFSNEEWDEPLSQSSNGSFLDMMPPPPPPPSRLHHLVNGLDDTLSINKRQPTLASDVAVNNATVDFLQLPSVPDDDLFGDSIVSQELGPSNGEEMTTIDLTEASGVPEDLEKPAVPEVDNRTKISKFQCVICMDDASTLTVTHCGHLYCAQCLHSSLHVEATKGKCPMCRAKIDMKTRAAYNSKTKGFWPLELKLMTATKKGKRKAEDMS